MKKFLLLILILVSSLFCTACVNNLAIQQLNQTGKELLDKGDYDGAISRFQASLDLDDSVFESRYNLGVAYIKKENYKQAIENLKQAIEINPTMPDAYYSYAVALEGEGLAFEEKILDNKEDDKNSNPPTEEEIKSGIELVKEAVNMYEKYLKMADNPTDKDSVLSHISELKETVLKYTAEEQEQEQE